MCMTLFIMAVTPFWPWLIHAQNFCFIPFLHNVFSIDLGGMKLSEKCFYHLSSFFLTLYSSVKHVCSFSWWVRNSELCMVKLLTALNFQILSWTVCCFAHHRYCVNLQYISLAFCNKFSDRGLHYLSNGKCSKKLEYLDLSGCLQVTPQGFQNLASGCINLTTLILDDFPTLMDDSIIVCCNSFLTLNEFWRNL